LAYIRAFNRFEIKYVLQYHQYFPFRESIKDYCRPDSHAGDNGFYPVHSLYFDSPNFRCFWEKIDGESFRRKLRARIYDRSGSIFLEIKQRLNKTVQKRRMLTDANTLGQFLGSSALTGNPRNKSIEAEILFLKAHYRLEPKIIVSYWREAFFASDQEGLRITFDKTMCFEDVELDLFGARTSEKRFIDDRLIIMEIKFNHTLPLWLTKLLRSHSLYIQKVSKYCKACEKAFPEIIYAMTEPRLFTIDGWRTRL
jgi:SPX domain protein involved in polyphosphate accumulation